MLDKRFYEAKASGDSIEFQKVCAECTAAGYLIQDGHLTATAQVYEAPPAPSGKEVKAKFGGDDKGAKRGRS